MFVGHLPAGYLVTKSWLARASAPLRRDRRLLILGLVASVVPDIDLLWFYFVDRRRHVHHAYWTHLPAFWLGLFAIAAIVLSTTRASRRAWLASAIIAANIMLHLVLDTIAGGVEWLWPVSNREYVLTHVPARYSPWYLNFFLHWTFALELLLVGLAIWLWLRQRELPGRIGGADR